MPRYYDLLGTMVEWRIAEWHVTSGSRYGDDGAESTVVTPGMLGGQVNENRRRPFLLAVQRESHSKRFG
jgi:hypothetical protein